MRSRDEFLFFSARAQVKVESDDPEAADISKHRLTGRNFAAVSIDGVQPGALD